MRPNISYGVYNSNIDTMERSLKERLFFVKEDGKFVEPYKPSSKDFTETLSKVSDYFKAKVKTVAPLTKEQFLRAYEGRRKTSYEEAFDSLRIRPLEKKDSYICFFTKAEKVNFTAKADPVPRGISPRHKRYHVTLGPYVKRIEHEIYELINRMYKATTVFKGLNQRKRGRVIKDHWGSFTNPVAIGMDASRFDQHVSRSALKWEHSIYQLFYPRNKFFSRLLRMQEVNRFFGRCPDGSVKARLEGGRMSGDMNTALGNVLLMCSMLYCYLKAHKITKFRVANDGDDVVLIIEKTDLSKLQNVKPWFHTIGFTMEVEEPVYVLEEIVFCQSQPIMIGQECVMVRQVPVSIAKDCLSIKPLDSETLYKRWITAVGECGMSLTGGVPIVQEFYMGLIRNGGGAKALKGDPTQETGLARLAIGMKRKYSSVLPSTRLSFWKAFGIDPANQVMREEKYLGTQLTYDTMKHKYHVIDVY